jgi:hypothetical protein
MRFGRALAFVLPLASAVALSDASGCAAGTDEPPTGDVTSGSGASSGAGSSKSSSAVSTSSASGASASSTSTGGSSSGSSSASTGSSSGATGGGGSSSGGAGGAGGSTATASTSSASSASSSVASSSSTGGAGGCATYGHTIAIDGVDDFASGEDFATSSSAYVGHVAWDATYLYVGMTGPDVATGSASRWFGVYLSGPTGGTTAGVTYNTQTPTLPFAAKWHVRWKADNSFTNALVFDGASWVDAAWDFTGDVFESADFVELRIPRADLGAPGKIDLAMDMLNEENNAEFTFAGVPQIGLTDAYDPDFTHYFSFDLDGCMSPTMFSPL